MQTVVAIPGLFSTQISIFLGNSLKIQYLDWYLEPFRNSRAKQLLNLCLISTVKVCIRMSLTLNLRIMNLP